MNKKKLVVYLIVISAVVLWFWKFNAPNQFVLDTSEIKIGANGCGNLTKTELANQLTSQNISIVNTGEGSITEIEVGECSVYKFTTLDGIHYGVSDSGNVSNDEN